MDKPKLQAVTIGKSVIIFENGKLKAQELPKSLVAAMFNKSLTSFRDEIKKLRISFIKKEMEEAKILEKDDLNIISIK